jgi:hypothetical protein
MNIVEIIKNSTTLANFRGVFHVRKRHNYIVVHGDGWKTGENKFYITGTAGNPRWLVILNPYSTVTLQLLPFVLLHQTHRHSQILKHVVAMSKLE